MNELSSNLNVNQLNYQMFSGGILAHQTLGSKRNRDSNVLGAPIQIRHPQYGRSGLLARAADEERMALMAAQSRRRGGRDRYNSTLTANTRDAQELSKFIPSPFVLTPMLLTGGMTSSVKRVYADEIGALQAQLRLLVDEKTAKAGAPQEPESVLETTRREMVERFLMTVEKDGEVAQVFDEKSANDASEALRLFNEMVNQEALDIKKRISSLQNQLQSKSSVVKKQAVAMLPTSYLQGLLHHHHFIHEAAKEVAREAVVCAEEVAAAASRSNSILPLPAMARKMMGQHHEDGDNGDVHGGTAPVERPDPVDVATTSFHHFVATTLRTVGTEFTRVELPLSITVDDLDSAELKRYPPAETGIVDVNGKQTFATTITAKSHTTLTKSIQIVVLKDGQPIVGQKPITTLQLIGEKYYENVNYNGGSSGSGRSRLAMDDPLAAFGFRDDEDKTGGNSSLKPKYRFHLLPFPNLENSLPPSKSSEVSVDTVAIFGRNPDQSTVLTEHPSCSGQHFAMFWTLAFTRNESLISPHRPTTVPLTVAETQWFLELQMCDLGASNGTVLLAGGASNPPLPKTPVGLVEVPSSQLKLNTSSATPTPQHGGAAVEKTVVMRVSCPFDRKGSEDIDADTKRRTSLPSFTLPPDVGFGPVASTSHTLFDGDQIVVGASTRRYVIVHDEEGIVSGY